MYQETTKYVPFSDLIGKTLSRIDGLTKDSEVVMFYTVDGLMFEMYHSGDCCETVTVDDVTGDISDLIGSPILKAEEAKSKDINPPGVPFPASQESFTWTFYKLATIKGYVDIRWYGESNGYYSEEVDFRQHMPQQLTDESS